MEPSEQQEIVRNGETRQPMLTTTAPIEWMNIFLMSRLWNDGVSYCCIFSPHLIQWKAIPQCEIWFFSHKCNCFHYNSFHRTFEWPLPGMRFGLTKNLSIIITLERLFSQDEFSYAYKFNPFTGSFTASITFQWPFLYVRIHMAHIHASHSFQSTVLDYYTWSLGLGLSLVWVFTCRWKVHVSLLLKLIPHSFHQKAIPQGVPIHTTGMPQRKFFKAWKSM